MNVLTKLEADESKKPAKSRSVKLVTVWFKSGLRTEESRAKEKLINYLVRDFELITSGYLIHEILSRQSSPV